MMAPLPALVQIPVGGYARPLNDQLYNDDGTELNLTGATVAMVLADPVTGLHLYAPTVTPIAGTHGNLAVTFIPPVLDSDRDFVAWYMVTFPALAPFATHEFYIKVQQQIDREDVPRIEALNWAPTVREVASYLLMRTVDDNGVERATFVNDGLTGTDGTRPTYDQTMELIGSAYSEVALVVGENPPAVLWDSAKRLAAIYAAMLVEITYYSSLINTTSSPYPQLYQLYTMGMKELKTAVATISDDGVLGADSASGLALWSTDTVYTGLVDWNTIL